MNTRIYQYSLFLLARQDYSEFKLRQKLKSQQKFSDEEIGEVILKLKEKNLLREENYRRLFIRKWMIRGESVEKIKRRGSVEKLEFETTEFNQVQSELGFHDEETVRRLISKKIGLKKIPNDSFEKKKFKEKILRFVISKGHSYEVSKNVLERLLQSNSDEYIDL